MEEQHIPEQPQQPEETPKRFSFQRRFPAFRELTVALSILVLIFGVTYIPDILEKARDARTRSASDIDSAMQQPASTEGRVTFDDINLEARSVYVYDVRDDKVLFSKNADATVPLASVTKLMTALVAHELLDMNGSVYVGMDAILQDGDSGFSKDEAFTTQNLLDLTLINSSNDGAYALAAAAGGSVFASGDKALTFVDAMNIRAREIGLTSTTFRNPTGLDLSTTTSGADGSAKDMATLMTYLISTYPSVLEETKVAHTLVANTAGATHIAENTNKAVTNIPGLIASKTGYTELAGGNLVVAFDAGLDHPVVIAILGSSVNGRFNDVKQLAAAAVTAVLQNEQ
ncbi:D-alanyl-D-alanine carboxypeptidase [Candidatus Parcubacteria bacterium]|uniref:Peptidase S11 D-alanyl-D-alanine carboxypeptidase A N-terminal domain-containing protein n=1 Tax=Candidatus Kaiserbacteria bacterium CG10_big_fil_rev_8_21_14_0_10_47_16 TaxID=1974608 RepID=A0A2H0UG16_9BACT|nr:D-alanyl-D-alanine carboxypeptidase [Candidatus Parcubacteria bacterium]PIR84745.1 MAG: hypothetical protein COU16_00985 [Candidatus Kaiserbacteria bacterium CG10_big_fil_rev_8_21_14_0_10_47_16]